MAEPAIEIGLGTRVAYLIDRSVVMMRVMPKMRRLLRFLLMLAVAGGRRESGVQRQHDQQKEGKETSHWRQKYNSRIMNSNRRWRQ